MDVHACILTHMVHSSPMVLVGGVRQFFPPINSIHRIEN